MQQNTNTAKHVSFGSFLDSRHLSFGRSQLEILQLNLGKLCNQACHHCHVEASPKRTEIMGSDTVDRIIELLSQPNTIHTVDITGGAPEMCPDFFRLVEACTDLNKTVLDRCNLTIFYEPGFETLPDFLRAHQVQVVASLPCYTESNVDKQRGRGVFGKSIQALQTLNGLGYGKPGTGLVLNLVYNPLGAFLPPSQGGLEADYKKKLFEDFEIEFNQLFCITNMPVKRFKQDLERHHRLEEYMALLRDHFNPHSVEGLMCRNLLSVSWDGKLYDCDFNQMQEMLVKNKPTSIWELESLNQFNEGNIATGDHCFGCTAGSGSSCKGALNLGDET